MIKTTKFPTSGDLQETKLTRKGYSLQTTHFGRPAAASSSSSSDSSNFYLNSEIIHTSQPNTPPALPPKPRELQRLFLRENQTDTSSVIESEQRYPNFLESEAAHTYHTIEEEHPYHTIKEQKNPFRRLVKWLGRS